MEKIRPNNGKGYKCDWCGMSYPLAGSNPASPTSYNKGPKY